MKDDEKKILIVDDDPDMCWVLEQILKNNNTSFLTVHTAGEAIHQLKTNGSRFELAFIDAKLPDLDGLELAKLIRKENSSIVVVMISGFFYKDGYEVVQALKDGTISFFIKKPFSNDEIAKFLHPLLKYGL